MTLHSKRNRKRLALVLFLVVVGWISWSLYNTYEMVRNAPTDPRAQKQAIEQIRSELANGGFSAGDPAPGLSAKERFFDQRDDVQGNKYTVAGYTYDEDSIVLYLCNDQTFAMQELRAYPDWDTKWHFCDIEKMTRYLELTLHGPNPAAD